MSSSLICQLIRLAPLPLITVSFPISSLLVIQTPTAAERLIARRQTQLTTRRPAAAVQRSDPMRKRPSVSNPERRQDVFVQLLQALFDTSARHLASCRVVENGARRQGLVVVVSGA
uniref:Secreted protein n=1 Tax=Steinernema glaseri TaxID=37863 RepID=A0A1I7Z0G6_9BILA